jgi:hypothetical protein
VFVFILWCGLRSFIVVVEFINVLVVFVRIFFNLFYQVLWCSEPIVVWLLWIVFRINWVFGFLDLFLSETAFILLSESVIITLFWLYFAEELIAFIMVDWSVLKIEFCGNCLILVVLSFSMQPFLIFSIRVCIFCCDVRTLRSGYGLFQLATFRCLHLVGLRSKFLSMVVWSTVLSVSFQCVPLLVQTGVLELLVVMRSHLILLDLRNMVRVGDFGWWWSWWLLLWCWVFLCQRVLKPCFV